MKKIVIVLLLLMGSLTQVNAQLGVINNNPGNIRKTSLKWRGEIKENKSAFEKYISMKWGARAHLKNLKTYIKRGNNTIEKIICVYAPPIENDTEMYIQFICKETGIKRKAILTGDKDTLTLIAYHMSRIENGTTPKITLELYKQAYDIL